MAIDDKEKTKEELEEPKKNKPFWQNLPPIVLIGGAVLLFLVFKSIMIDTSGGSQQFFVLLLIIAILVILSKASPYGEGGMITPKEAELLVERECERKRRWGQFPLMSTYKVGPVSDMMHRDSRGIYYNVAVELLNPYYRNKYYVGKVMADGKEKGFTTLIESIGPLDGRKIMQEKDYSKPPEWLKKAGKHSILEKFWLGGR